MRKPRSAIALQMILTRKGGPMRDRKKHEKATACHQRIDTDT